MRKSTIVLSLAAMATLAACGGRSYDRPVSAAPTTTVATQPAQAVIYPGGVAVVQQPAVIIETTPLLRPGFGRVTANQQVYFNNGTPAGAQRLTLAMSDGSVQVVDTRGPAVAVGAEVEITTERHIRYPVASGKRY